MTRHRYAYTHEFGWIHHSCEEIRFAYKCRLTFDPVTLRATCDNCGQQAPFSEVKQNSYNFFHKRDPE